MSDRGKLAGVDKAAALMISIGVDAAAEIMKHLTPVEINTLSLAIARMGSVTAETRDVVFKEVTEMLGRETAVGGEEFACDVLDRALGADHARSFAARLQQGGLFAGLDALRLESPRVLAETVKAEHPQVIAMVFAALEPEQVDAMIQHLPPELVADVIPRLATLDSVPPAAIRELQEAITDLLVGDVDQGVTTLGGVSMAAKILNRIGEPQTAEILGQISGIDPDLAQQIENNMFVFEDLVQLDDRNFQILLRTLDQKLLSNALKSTIPELQEKVFANMSQRAADMLRDEIETQGAVRIADITAAKREIVATAQRLEREGTIVLSTDSSQVVM